MTEQASPQLGLEASQSGWIDSCRTILASGMRDAAAGFVSAIVLIANIISFAALMFSGEFSSGIPFAIWSMLVGSCICGLIVSLKTSLPPLATGIDSPTGAVLVLLSVNACSLVTSAGGTT